MNANLAKHLATRWAPTEACTVIGQITVTLPGIRCAPMHMQKFQNGTIYAESINKLFNDEDDLIRHFKERGITPVIGYG